ncbi:unnamed protein product, partial [Protopolystoma xenopodis]
KQGLGCLVTKHEPITKAISVTASIYTVNVDSQSAEEKSNNQKESELSEVPDGQQHIFASPDGLPRQICLIGSTGLSDSLLRVRNPAWLVRAETPSGAGDTRAPLATSESNLDDSGTLTITALPGHLQAALTPVSAPSTTNITSLLQTLENSSCCWPKTSGKIH